MHVSIYYGFQKPKEWAVMHLIGPYYIPDNGALSIGIGLLLFDFGLLFEWETEGAE